MLPMYGNMDEEIKNLVGQINPKTIIDELNHSLKGEYWNKEQNEWIMNESKKPLVNDACRSSVISYLNGILTNNTTMANLDEKHLSYMMESVIEAVNKMFVCNLELFGFVPPGEKFKQNVYENKGTPDTATMTLVSSMIFKVCYLVFSRALKGQESIRIFKSLSMSERMGMGMGGMPQPKQSWTSRLFGGGQN